MRAITGEIFLCASQNKFVKIGTGQPTQSSVSKISGPSLAIWPLYQDVTFKECAVTDLKAGFHPPARPADWLNATVRTRLSCCHCNSGREPSGAAKAALHGVGHDLPRARSGLSLVSMARTTRPRARRLLQQTWMTQAWMVVSAGYGDTTGADLIRNKWQSIASNPGFL